MHKCPSDSVHRHAVHSSGSLREPWKRLGGSQRAVLGGEMLPLPARLHACTPAYTLVSSAEDTALEGDLC